MTPKTQTVKQIMVNVSEKSKDRINELKEQLKLTDKEFIAIALQVFDAAKTDDIQTIVEKLAVEKQTAKIEARLARIQIQVEKAKGELVNIQTPTETSDEVEDEIEGEVVYDASLEEELVG